MKISDEVPRDIPHTIHAVNFSAGLNDMFHDNLDHDSTMRYTSTSSFLWLLLSSISGIDYAVKFSIYVYAF